AVYHTDDTVGDLDVHPVDGWVACSSGTIHCLAAESLQPVSPGYPKRGRTFRFTPDGLCLLENHGGVVQVVPLEAPAQTRSIPAGLSGTTASGAIDRLVCSPDGTLLLSASSREVQASLWELTSGRLLARLGTGAGCSLIGFAPDGQSFAVTGNEQTHV